MARRVETDYTYEDGEPLFIEVGTREDDGRLDHSSMYLQVGSDQKRVLNRYQALKLVRHLTRALEDTL